MSQHVLNKFLFKILEKYYRTGHLVISVFSGTGNRKDKAVRVY